MELKEFIKATLVDIHKSIQEANEEIDKDTSTFELERRVNKNGTMSTKICFDVAVTATEEGETSASAGISVLGIGLLGSKVDGKLQNQNISRIQFSISPKRNLS